MTDLHVASSQPDGHADSPFSPDLTERLRLESLENLVKEVAQRLCVATVQHRADGQAVTANERQHAERWARRAVMMMCQAIEREVARNITNLWAGWVAGLAEESKAFDEDASWAAYTNQAVDRLALPLLRGNPMTAFMQELDLACGVKK